MTETDSNRELAAPFEGWSILELMGHRRLAGYVSEQEVAGQGFLRLDVFTIVPGPAVATQFYSPSAVYCLTPTTEEIARAIGAKATPAPVSRWELPPARDSQSPPGAAS